MLRRVCGWPLRRLVVVLVTLLVLFALLPALLADMVFATAKREEAVKGMMRLAGEQGASALDRRLREVGEWSREAADDLAPFAEVGRRAGLRARYLAPLLVRNQLSSAFVLDRHGRVALSAGQPARPELLAGWPEFRRALAGEASLTDVYRDVKSEHAYYAAMAPVRRGEGGPVVGVLVLEDPIDGVIQRLVAHGTDLAAPGSFHVLVDEHDIRLAHGTTSALTGQPLFPLPDDLRRRYHAERRLGVRTAALLASHMFPATRQSPLRAFRHDPRAERADISLTQYPTFRNGEVRIRRRYFHLAALTHKPWILAVSVPEVAYLAYWWQELYINLGIGLVVLLVAASVTLLLTDRLLRPLLGLHAAASTWIAGDQRARAPIAGNREFVELSTTFNRMADELAARTARLETLVEERTEALLAANRALRESERHLARAQAIAGIWDWEWEVATGRFSRSPRVSGLHALVPGGELPAPEAVMTVMPAGYRDDLEAMAREAAETQGGVVREVRIEQPDGSWRILRAMAEARCDEQGRPLVMLGTFQDVTEQKDLEALLLEQNEHLRDLDRLKRLFVGAVSHDLRGPVGTIHGYCTMLMEGFVSPLTPKQREYVVQIYLGSLRLERLVDDLFDLVRLDAGTFALNLTETDLAETIRAVTAGLMPLIDQAGLSVELSLPITPLRAMLDAPRVERVLINLIQNAIKFTPAGGRIRIGATVQDGVLRCEVEDSGEGIAPADLPRLFLNFSQLELGARKGGIGLGLSICKAIVEAHGGSIGVHNRVAGGATFFFDLPV